MPELFAQKMRVSLDAQLLSEPLRRAYALAQSGNRQEALSCLTEELLSEIQGMEPGTESQIAHLFVLAQTWQSLERIERVIEAYEAIRRVRLDIRVYYELIRLYHKVAQFSRAFDCAQEAMAHWKDYPEIKVLYGKCLLSLGRLQEGLEWMEGLIDSGEMTPEGHLATIWHLNYRSDIDRQTLFRAQRAWVERYTPASWACSNHENSRDPQRRLKLGYLSGDFRTHSVVYTFESLLDGRNREDFEVFGYGHVEEPDPTTQRLQSKFDHYRDLRGLTPEAVAQTIRDDQIDILVGLATHCHTICMQVMARKPAPIQVDIGSLCSTGLSQIDFRIVDGLLDPPHVQSSYTERLVHPPGGFLPYRPPADAPAVGPLPARRNGQVTFGSFANHLKINNEVVACWSEILRRIPRSRLLIKAGGGHDEGVNRLLCERFAQQGIDPKRIRVVGWLPKPEHWDLYNQVDIALDTFPYNGCLTTFEALWMGVPMVTLVGEVSMARVGLVILQHVGLQAAVAYSTEEMIAKTEALTRDLKVLEKLRTHLRSALQASCLCDSAQMARETEAAYRQMWIQWCRGVG